MRIAAKKWTSVGAVVLMSGLGLAACGSDDETGSGETAVGEDAGTELTQENFFAELTQAQLEAGSTHVTMDMGEQAQGMALEGDIVIAENPDDTRLAMTMEAEEAGMGTIEMRMLDSVFYMNFGEMTQGQFVEMDLTDESNPLGEQFGSMTDQMDPAKQLEVLEEAVTGFEQSGEAEQIDGVEATPYQITVDATQVMDQFGEMPEGAQDQIPDEISYTMYVGPDNLPRRVVVDMAPMATTMEYSRWGEDVTVEKPADDEITDQNPFEAPGGA